MSMTMLVLGASSGQIYSYNYLKIFLTTYLSSTGEPIMLLAAMQRHFAR